MICRKLFKDGLTSIFSVFRIPHGDKSSVQGFQFSVMKFCRLLRIFRGFELRAEGWERWRGEKRRGGGEEEGQWARILNITYANIQIAKCWSFPHSAFRMEISQVCKAFSFPCWSFAAFKAHLSRFRACFILWNQIQCFFKLLFELYEYNPAASAASRGANKSLSPFSSNSNSSLRKWLQRLSRGGVFI